jgi:hypothetical protein
MHQFSSLLCMRERRAASACRGSAFESEKPAQKRATLLFKPELIQDAIVIVVVEASGRSAARSTERRGVRD